MLPQRVSSYPAVAGDAVERGADYPPKPLRVSLGRNYLIPLRNHDLQIYSPRVSQSHRERSEGRQGRRQGAGLGVGMLEGLERRRMLAVAVSVALGKLTVTGDGS